MDMIGYEDDVRESEDSHQIGTALDSTRQILRFGTDRNKLGKVTTQTIRFRISTVDKGMQSRCVEGVLDPEDQDHHIGKTLFMPKVIRRVGEKVDA